MIMVLSLTRPCPSCCWDVQLCVWRVGMRSGADRLGGVPAQILAGRVHCPAFAAAPEAGTAAWPERQPGNPSLSQVHHQKPPQGQVQTAATYLAAAHLTALPAYQLGTLLLCHPCSRHGNHSFVTIQLGLYSRPQRRLMIAVQSRWSRFDVVVIGESSWQGSWCQKLMVPADADSPQAEPPRSDAWRGCGSQPAGDAGQAVQARGCNILGSLLLHCTCAFKGKEEHLECHDLQMSKSGHGYIKSQVIHAIRLASRRKRRLWQKALSGLIGMVRYDC